MNLDLIKFIGVQYDNGSLDSGSYKVYHSSIDPNNLLSNEIYTEQDLFQGVKIYKENFPQSFVYVLENDISCELVIEKV